MICKQFPKHLAGTVKAEFDCFFAGILHPGNLAVAHAVPSGENEYLTQVMLQFCDGILHGNKALVGDSPLIGSGMSCGEGQV